MNEQISTSMIIPGSTTRTISPYYDEEVTLIHRSYKQKELEWTKQKIKMEQKIEFLEIQMKEINERETNLKNLNNSIMTAFNDLSKDREKTPKEIEFLNEQHGKEIHELRRKYEKMLREMEEERDEFKKSLLLSLEDKSKMERDIKYLSERTMDYEERLHKWDENNYLRERHIKETVDTENGLKLKDLRNEMQKLKETHLREKETLEQNCQKNIENLKFSFDQEKKLLMGKMDALKEEIGLLNRNNSKSNSIYEELKAKMNEEMVNVRQQKEELVCKLEGTLNNNQQLKFQIKEAEQSFENRTKSFRDEKILLQEEIKRLKQTLSDNQNKIKKIEHSEKTLRTLLNEKESYMDEEKNDMKKKLMSEKKKNEQMVDFANKIKEEYNKKHAIIVQEILNKEEEIKKLKQTISKMTNSARRLDKSQEKSPFRTSCYHQNCTAKASTLDNFYDNNNQNNNNNHNSSKQTDEFRHFCSCNELSVNNDTKNLMNSNVMCKNLENHPLSPKEISLNMQNKSTLHSEKNYDLPLKRDHFETFNKSSNNNINNNWVQNENAGKNIDNNWTQKENMGKNTNNNQPENLNQNPNKQCENNTKQNQPQTTTTKKPNTTASKTQALTKDYSKRLTSLLNKENEFGKAKAQQKNKKQPPLDPNCNRSLLIDPSHDYSTLKSNTEISTSKSKFPSKSPKIPQKQDFFKRNRSISKHEKNQCSTNNLPQIAEHTSRNFPTHNHKSSTPTNNHLTINNMIGVLNLPSSIECTICRKVVAVAEFVEHLNLCAGIFVENPCDSNQQQSHTVLSDLSNIQHNLSFNTSSELPEVEKRPKHVLTIHESIPNERVLNRKLDENFFSLAPGLVYDDNPGNFLKNESQRYADSPSEINMTNEFSTSHKKGFEQENLINSSFVIKSMNEIKRNTKK